MSKKADARNLNEEFRERLLDNGHLKTIVDWIVDNSYWVDPKIHKKIHVVYPRARRKRTGEKRGWSSDGFRLDDNALPKDAFWRAHGESKDDYDKFALCHIYDRKGVDSEKHFTNLANMIVLPEALKSLSEWKPISDILKYRSRELYGYRGPKNSNCPSEEPLGYPSRMAKWRHLDQKSPKDRQNIVSNLESSRDFQIQESEKHKRMAKTAGPKRHR